MGKAPAVVGEEDAQESAVAIVCFPGSFILQECKLTFPRQQKSLVNVSCEGDGCSDDVTGRF